jgi:hypothetical protein|tara:strand:- start:457 stop:696 length:240 start_codon:yes stop_codon:yes gene_type:complete
LVKIDKYIGEQMNIKTAIKVSEELSGKFKLTPKTKSIIDNMDINSPNFVYMEKMITDIAEFTNYFLISVARKKEKLNGN